jgi:hypothetical protein
LRTRLQRLRPTHPKRETPSPATPPLSGGEGLPGGEQLTAHGGFQLIEARYPLSQPHGHSQFGALLQHPSATVAKLAKVPPLTSTPVEQLAFIDTETTGLAGGAGTIAFLVGVGLFAGDEFILRQYFLRQPDEEPAMLLQLKQDMAAHSGWITFNGRAFDLPLLENRFTMNRQRSDFRQRPHWDLLFPARWLYRGRLASCSLNSLEQNVLGVARTEDDVPGELIPLMYVNYLRTGQTHEMRRVIYHNALDILSMVTLATHLLEVFGEEGGAHNPQHAEGSKRKLVNREQSAENVSRFTLHPSRRKRPPEEWLRLAEWHDREERLAEAEAAYRQALALRLSLEHRAEALTKFAALLKRMHRRVEAVPLWEQLASFTVDDALPCIELAKFYEWKAADMAQAQEWAARAEKIIKTMPPGWRKNEAQAAIAKRLERLRGKV